MCESGRGGNRSTNFNTSRWLPLLSHHETTDLEPREPFQRFSRKWQERGTMLSLKRNGHILEHGLAFESEFRVRTIPTVLT
jgi:hypothetical protein